MRGARMELRPYQQEAMAAVQAQWEEGRRKTLLVLPTGCGKTIVFCKLAEELVRQGQRVLILAHRGELLEQAAVKLQESTGLACALEKAESSSLGSWCRVVVGSVQSLTRQKRLEQFAPQHFGAVIVDEAHHILSDSYQRVLQHFAGTKVLGVTATPDRADMRNLGQFFDSLAYEYTLPQAIREGYLAPIRAQTIPLQLDLSGVAMQSGDFKAADLDCALEPYLQQIASEMHEKRQPGGGAAGLCAGEYDVLCKLYAAKPRAGNCPRWIAWWCCGPPKAAAYTANGGPWHPAAQGKEYLLLLISSAYGAARALPPGSADLRCTGGGPADDGEFGCRYGGRPGGYYGGEQRASDEVWPSGRRHWRGSFRKCAGARPGWLTTAI